MPPSKKDDKLFADLRQNKRKITPRTLTGEAKENWNRLHRSYHAGEWDGISNTTLFAWAKRHCNITCVMSTFNVALAQPLEGHNV